MLSLSEDTFEQVSEYNIFFNDHSLRSGWRCGIVLCQENCVCSRQFVTRRHFRNVFGDRRQTPLRRYVCQRTRFSRLRPCLCFLFSLLLLPVTTAPSWPANTPHAPCAANGVKTPKGACGPGGTDALVTVRPFPGR